MDKLVLDHFTKEDLADMVRYEQLDNYELVNKIADLEAQLAKSVTTEYHDQIVQSARSEIVSLEARNRVLEGLLSQIRYGLYTPIHPVGVEDRVRWRGTFNPIEAIAATLAKSTSQPCQDGRDSGGKETGLGNKKGGE
jgi:hypothetical protein